MVIQTEDCNVFWESKNAKDCIFLHNKFFACETAQLTNGTYQIIRDEQAPEMVSWQLECAILRLEYEEQTRLTEAFLQIDGRRLHGRIGENNVQWTLQPNVDGEYQLVLADVAGNRSERFLPIQTGFELPQAAAAQLQTFPNPANPEAVIAFSLPENAEPIRLKIYNVKGQCVRSWENISGSQVRWNGQNQQGETAASGIYFVQLQHSQGVLSCKMALMK